MNVAHLILAHTAPHQLARLIDRLRHANAYFFIHVDAKANLDDFLFLGDKEHVYLIGERVKVSWGAYSIVQATLNGFTAIAGSNLNINCVNLLSGSDYPLKTAIQIHSYLLANTGHNFMEYLLVHEQWQEAVPRISEYHLTDFSFPGQYFVQKWINKLLPGRQMPNQLIPVGKSQWMTISMEAVQYILRYIDANPQVVRFFRFTWAPDELFFQTILYNSGFRETLVNTNLRYIDWADGKASPKTFSEDDLGKLVESDALFARKFDMYAHPELLNKLDQKILSPI